MAEPFPRAIGPNGAPPELFKYPGAPEQRCPFVDLGAGGQAHLAVTRADVMVVLTKSDAFGLADVQEQHAVSGGTLQGEYGLLRLDKPDITEAKRVLGPLTSREEAERHRPDLEAIAQKHAARVKAGIRRNGGVLLDGIYTQDFIEEASRIILGLRRVQMAGIATAANSTLREVRDQNDISLAQDGWARAYDLYEGYIEEKRRQPDQKLLSRLITRLEDKGFTGDRLLQVTASFLNGFPTLTSIMDICMVKLLQRPEVVKACQKDPAKWDACLEELLRHEAHFTSILPRVALKDTVLPDGGPIKAGEVVIPSLEAALHDPADAENPNEFDPAQKAKRKLVFGAGGHLCPGEALSRQILRTGLETFFSVNPRLTLADSRVQWSEGNPPFPF